MKDKRPFVEPRIVSDNDLEAADRNFPLMPLIMASGGAPTGDSITDGGGGDTFDPIAADTTD